MVDHQPSTVNRQPLNLNNKPLNNKALNNKPSASQFISYRFHRSVVISVSPDPIQLLLHSKKIL
ncbi:MAG: hypothetical protein F6K63_10035 [Moorea sp. SIO1G6]|nr:hypothetical protein [Moorena sp. SIO4E2]NET64709.1 hypothetical protein [Moorena sp. SIO1G6]